MSMSSVGKCWIALRIAIYCRRQHHDNTHSLPAHTNVEPALSKSPLSSQVNVNPEAAVVA
jgi:hypothetical protein